MLIEISKGYFVDPVEVTGVKPISVLMPHTFKQPISLYFTSIYFSVDSIISIQCDSMVEAENKSIRIANRINEAL